MNQHKWLKWTGRIGGLLVTLFFGAFMVGEGWPDLQDGKSQELLPVLLLMAVPFFGFFIAWRKPVTGGWVMLAGALLLACYCWYSSDWAMMAAYAGPALLVALCFLAAGNKEMI